MQFYMFVIYLLIISWLAFSIYYILVVKRLGVSKVIPDLYHSIPSVFTTIGVLGTFVGIYFGLKEFDVTNITESIPVLLEGLKTAFITSIIGISLSLIFGRISDIVYNSAINNTDLEQSGDTAILSKISENISAFKSESSANSSVLISNLTGDSDTSISTHFSKMRNQFTDLLSSSDNQNNKLDLVVSGLGGDGETSLLTQMQKLRAEQNSYSAESKKNVEWIINAMTINNKLIERKFDEFSELMAKNNTEALVEVMKRATEEFNAQMSALIEKLVQENFKELNNSVNRLNTWQQENKEMIGTLTDQFTKVTSDIEKTAVAVKDITTNTSKLTNENSNLSKMIIELQNVMIEDTKYQEIVKSLTSTIDTLKQNTVAFDETTNKLNNWVRSQMGFTDNVEKLLIRLDQIDKIKDINDVFWNNTKDQLNQGVSIIEKANTKLSNDLESINSEFYERLSTTLQSLDTLIQRIITNHR